MFCPVTFSVLQLYARCMHSGEFTDFLNRPICESLAHSVVVTTAVNRHKFTVWWTNDHLHEIVFSTCVQRQRQSRSKRVTWYPVLRRQFYWPKSAGWPVGLVFGGGQDEICGLCAVDVSGNLFFVVVDGGRWRWNKGVDVVLCSSNKCGSSGGRADSISRLATWRHAFISQLVPEQCRRAPLQEILKLTVHENLLPRGTEPQLLQLVRFDRWPATTTWLIKINFR